MTRVFITGGSSVIGRHILRDLLTHGCQVTALIHRRPLESAGDAATVSGSILDPAAFADEVRQAQVVIHLAGLTHSDDPRQYDEINRVGTERLLGVCASSAFFVYVSSRCAHPEGGAYGISKFRAEQTILTGGRRYAIIRPAEVYGTKAGEGIDRLLGLALRTRVVPDFRWHGPVAYAPIAADEVADFLVQAALQPRHDQAVYPLCAARSWTAADMARELTRIRKRRHFCLPIPVRALDALSRMGVPMPFKSDQLARLKIPRQDNLSAAHADYGFNPRPFNDYLTQLCT
jgi:nucleoside-diphosphate-sugar epimerase